MPRYNVDIVFDDGSYHVAVIANSEARAYTLALIDARMAHSGAVSYGRVVSVDIKEKCDVDKDK